jgi:hypothetical protein
MRAQLLPQDLVPLDTAKAGTPTNRGQWVARVLRILDHLPFIPTFPGHPKSVHKRLVHSRSDLCLFLCSDVLDCRGDGGLIVEL